MGTLKEIRIEFNLSQADVARKVGTTQSVVSNYESGVTLPPLEEIIILEKMFSQPIDWPDKASPKEKRETIQAIIELCERYPLEAVSEFAARVYRRTEVPTRMIRHYASCIQREDENLTYEV